jgi:tetratricopeptide (TPR) repeat protein
MTMSDAEDQCIFKDLISRSEQSARAGQFEMAGLQLQIALAIQSPGRKNAKKKLAGYLLKLARYEHAELLLRSLVDRHPGDADLIVNLAHAVFGRGKFDEAIALFEQVRQGSPNLYGPVMQRQHGNSLLETRNFAGATEVFMRLQKQRPGSPSGIVGLAHTAMGCGDWEAAVGIWKSCMAKFPEKISDRWNICLEQCESAAKGNVPNLDFPQNSADSENAMAYANLLERSARGASNDHPLNFETVFIVTYGRAGSTLLQGVLNSINGVVVRGENNNVFAPLFETYQKMISLRSRYKTNRLPNRPFFGAGTADIDQALAHMRSLAKTLIHADQAGDPNVSCFGFKEIGYQELGDEFSEYLNFLGKIFPNPAYVFLTRDLADVSKSGWWKDLDAQSVVDDLAALDERFIQFSSDRSDCFSLTYDDVISKSGTLVGLFEFLGAQYNPHDIDILLATPHSYAPSQDGVQQLFSTF